MIVALVRCHVSVQGSVCTCFLKARLSQDLVCRVVCGRLVEVTSGHPRPSLFGHRGCPCRDPPVCRRVQGDSVATRQPWLCVCWSRDVVCVPCARVRGRASRSCATENTYTPARLEALVKLSVVAIHSPSYHFDQIFCGLWVFLVQDLIEMLLLAVCSVAIHLVHANTNLFLGRLINFECCPWVSLQSFATREHYQL